MLLPTTDGMQFMDFMKQKQSITALLCLSVSIGLAGCGGGSSDNEFSSGSDNWYKPSVDTTWQWQLTGTLNTDYDVDLYDIDLFDTSADTIAALQQDGRRVICYFSAGSYEYWRDDADDFPNATLGGPMDGWNERWIDIRSSEILTLMEARLDLAAQKGCDGVEPDNVDGYSNTTGFDLTAQDQLTYNQALADAAHTRGLAIGLKNDLDQINELVDSFDFAVNEQCNQYDECDLLSPFIEAGKPVFNAEYADLYVDDETERNQLCQSMNDSGIRTLVLPLDLDDSFRFSCF
jgi:hypothetical protein